jgi:tetratricopeptide (TPR) repeat protein
MGKRNNFLDIPPQNPNQKSYRIIFEKQADNLKLEKKEREQLEELHVKIQEEPQKQLAALIQFCEKHPAIPEAANLLAFAYLKLKKGKEAEEWIEKTYHNHPHYLIARINYADQALRLKKPERIAAIFNGCFDLHQLYPEREVFHYAEFRGFMTVMGFYHLQIGKREKAEEYYQMAFQVDPLHPSVAALEKALTKRSWLKRIFSSCSDF